MKRYMNIHQDVIDQSKKENSRAQFKLYKLYFKSMFNTSFRIVNNTMEAEDIMQESFLAAFEKLNTYKGEVSFGAWLKRIVVNRCLDFLRKNSVIFEEISEKITESSDSNESTYENNEENLKLINKAISELSDGYRVVLSLFFIEGYDHQEISEILGITSSTSRSQLARAKQKLIERLENFKS